MHALHTNQRAALVPKPNEEITIISAGNSPDALISYINFMRQRLNLGPLTLDQKLSSKARRKGLELQRKNVVLLKSQLAKYNNKSNLKNGKKTHLISSPVIESKEYLDYALSHQCNSVGIHTCEKSTENKIGSITIQVFSLSKKYPRH